MESTSLLPGLSGHAYQWQACMEGLMAPQAASPTADQPFAPVGQPGAHVCKPGSITRSVCRRSKASRPGMAALVVVWLGGQPTAWKLLEVPQLGCLFSARLA
jgi:hypothetical protein